MAILVTGSSTLNTSESRVRTRLGTLGFTVSVVDDSAITTTKANGVALVVMSKTVSSTTVGTKLKGTTAHVLFWEDNQQQLSMLATINSSNTTGTGWHTSGQQVRTTAPINFYTSAAEITYAPRSNTGTPTVTASAEKIAQFGSTGDGRWVVYTIPLGTTLADGTRATGRRSYFGLYDDTFKLLTADGLALFDNLVLR